MELLELLDASLFLRALRRFFAIRGPALRLRCDRGTNFVGAKTEIDEALVEMDKESVAKYLSEQNCEWLFNPPHTSHYGGVWERQIGTIRRILDAMPLELGARQLTHELLTTLISEVAKVLPDPNLAIGYRRTVDTGYVADAEDTFTRSSPG